MNSSNSFPHSGQGPRPEEFRELGRDEAIDTLLRLRKHTERRLTPEPRARSDRFTGLAMAASITLLLGCIGWLLTQESDQPAFAALLKPTPQVDTLQENPLALQVVQLSGEVRRLRNDGSDQQLKIGDLIHPQDQIQSSEGSSINVILSDGTELELDRHSILKNTISKKEKGLFLERGRGYVKAAPQEAGSTLQIQTPYGAAKVVGTHFKVESLTSHMALAVDEGIVEVAQQNKAGKMKQKHLIYADQLAEIDSKNIYIMNNDTAAANIVSFSIVDSTSGQVVPEYRELEDGATIHLDSIPGEFTIVANTKGRIHRLVWESNQKRHPKVNEFLYPYSFPGDNLTTGGGYYPLILRDNQLKLTAKALDRDGSLLSTKSLTVNFIRFPQSGNP